MVRNHATRRPSLGYRRLGKRVNFGVMMIDYRQDSAA